MSSKRFLGRNARLYYADDWDDSAYARLKTRTTLSLARDKSLEDVTAEDSDGEEWQQAILNQRGVEFEMFFDANAAADPRFIDLDAACEADEPLVFAVAYGKLSVDGTKYRKMHLYVTEFAETLDASGAGKVKVTLTPGPTPHKPVTLVADGEDVEEEEEEEEEPGET